MTKGEEVIRTLQAQTIPDLVRTPRTSSSFPSALYWVDVETTGLNENAAVTDVIFTAPDKPVYRIRYTVQPAELKDGAPVPSFWCDEDRLISAGVLGDPGAGLTSARHARTNLAPGT